MNTTVNVSRISGRLAAASVVAMALFVGAAGAAEKKASTFFVPPKAEAVKNRQIAVEQRQQQPNVGSKFIVTPKAPVVDEQPQKNATAQFVTPKAPVVEDEQKVAALENPPVKEPKIVTANEDQAVEQPAEQKQPVEQKVEEEPAKKVEKVEKKLKLKKGERVFETAEGDIVVVRRDGSYYVVEPEYDNRSYTTYDNSYTYGNNYSYGYNYGYSNYGAYDNCNPY